MQEFSWHAGDEAEAQAEDLADDVDNQPAPKRTFEESFVAELGQQTAGFLWIRGGLPPTYNQLCL